MTQIQASIPCRVCRKPVHGTHEGKGYAVGTHRFAICHGCDPMFTAGVNAFKVAAKTGMTRFVLGRFPWLRSLVPAINEMIGEV